MNKFFYKLFLIVIACSLGIVSALAIPDPSYAQTTKSKEGLNFTVPDDWPIEKRGGIVGPIPTEEYVAMKFGKTDEAMEAMKKEYEDKIKALEEKLMAMEEMMNVKLAEANAKPADGSASAGLSADEQLRLEEVEKQLGRLDRKITNKITEIKKEYEGKTLSVTKFEEELENLDKKIGDLDTDIEYLYGYASSEK